MKKLSLVLLSSLMLSTPAWADPHQGQQGGQPQMMQAHQHSPEMIKQHLPKAQQRISELKKLAERAVELLQHAHKLTAKAQQDKQLTSALQAAQAFEAGRELHHENMQALKKMQEHLAKHLGDHYAGTVVLDASLLAQLQSSSTELGSFIQTHRDFCQKNIMPQNQKMLKELVALGHIHFEKALAAGDTEALLKAVKLFGLKAGH